MNYFAFPPLLTGAILAAIGFFVYFNNRKSNVNQAHSAAETCPQNYTTSGRYKATLLDRKNTQKNSLKSCIFS